ncbi:MAG: chorismate synthase, partial [Acidipropionibacterium acidipropionici]|nr:chorismate synthase [Acidipropionibacterium acidipropionici]
MVALVLAESALEKFGGDSLAETRRNHESYLARIAERHLEIAPHE